MAETSFLSRLQEDVESWNRWRRENPSVSIDLSGADLSDETLENADLSGCDLQGADLFGANLTGANLKLANLASADLSSAILNSASMYKANFSQTTLIEASCVSVDAREVNFDGADLRGAVLTDANLGAASLIKANLSRANLSNINLSQARIQDANFCHATISGADVSGIQYGDTRTMKGHYQGIRGLSSTFGSAVFVRDGQDQDYLDTLALAIQEHPPGFVRNWRQFWFTAWGWIDYGRSLGRTALYACFVAFAYSLFYLADMLCSWGFVDFTSSAKSWFTPFYYSIVTYTTLGFGDITPKHWIGEIVVVSEVILGYTTLGLLLSILANKVARRS
jgi:hypothetical protein